MFIPTHSEKEKEKNQESRKHKQKFRHAHRPPPGISSLDSKQTSCQIRGISRRFRPSMRLKRSCPREFQENRASERKHLRFRYCLQAWLRDGATIEGFSPRILAFEGTQKRGRRVCSELEKSKQKGHSSTAGMHKVSGNWSGARVAQPPRKPIILVALKIPERSESLDQALAIKSQILSPSRKWRCYPGKKSAP
jgi:hypothetical protein